MHNPPDGCSRQPLVACSAKRCSPSRSMGIGMSRLRRARRLLSEVSFEQSAVSGARPCPAGCGPRTAPRRQPIDKPGGTGCCLGTGDVPQTLQIQVPGPRNRVARSLARIGVA